MKDTPSGAQQLMQHSAHMDRLVEEISRLLPKLPGHKEMGITEGDKARFITASKHARNFTLQQMQSIIARSQSFINYKRAIRRNEDSDHITDWIEEILDASMGYKKAHTWTRPNSKAPPLPTHMWKKGKYISHPHEMGDMMLKEWGNIWTQGIGDAMAEEMWEKILQLIITSRAHAGDMDQITEKM